MVDALVTGLAVATASTCSVAAAFMIFSALFRDERSTNQPQPDTEGLHFIFHEGRLADSTPRAGQLMQSLRKDDANTPGNDLVVLLSYLQRVIPDIAARIDALLPGASISLSGCGRRALSVQAQYRGGFLHMRVLAADDEAALLAIDSLSYGALQDELHLLRQIADRAPFPVWRCTSSGMIDWANSEYISLLAQLDPACHDLTWPLPPLFEIPSGCDRLALELRGKSCVFTHRTAPTSEGDLHYALPVDAGVQSEISRRDMIQMLTRTFASLPVGLALFDAKRRLQVFNPALVDLTGLDPLLLAGRPSLEQVLFALRERRMLPEPKDFGAWREAFMNVEAAAKAGEYDAEWCLDNGRVYHVSGRPQPNGAIAFFWEDVSTEATLARSYRARIERDASVIDALPDAVLVSDTSGQVLTGNAAFRRLSGLDPAASLGGGGLGTVLGHLRQISGGAVIWQRITELADAPEQGVSVQGSCILSNGNILGVRAQWLAGGLLMLTLRETGPQEARALPELSNAAIRDRLSMPDAVLVNLDMSASDGAGLKAAPQARPFHALPAQDRSALASSRPTGLSYFVHREETGVTVPSGDSGSVLRTGAQVPAPVDATPLRGTGSQLAAPRGRSVRHVGSRVPSA